MAGLDLAGPGNENGCAEARLENSTTITSSEVATTGTLALLGIAAN